LQIAATSPKLPPGEYKRAIPLLTKLLWSLLRLTSVGLHITHNVRLILLSVSTGGLSSRAA